MSNQDINLFKDEILKKIREVEMKFLKQLSNKNFEINLNYENFSEKVNSILESNKLMIESITNQKLNFEKISKLELNTNQIVERITTNEIRISNLLNEMKKMKFNYDKTISENLIIPAYIGPGGMFKSLGEFIINFVEEFKKFKAQKENLKNDNIEMKTKMELMNKNLTNFVEFNTSRCKAYTDSKEKEYQLKFDDKFKQLDEKSIENNQNIFSKQIQFEEKLKEFDEKIRKISLNNNKTDVNLLIYDKFEEIKRKEDEMNEKLQRAIKEVQELKLIKKELKEEMKNINLKIIDLNKNKKIKVIEQNKINPDFLNLIKKENINNSYMNTFYNSDSNLINLSERQNKNKKNNFPNISNILNPMIINKIDKNENINEILKNEKKPIILNYNSKPDNIISNNIVKPQVIKEKASLKSTSNLIDENNFKESGLKLEEQRIENNFLSPRGLNNNKVRVKEKLYQKSTNDLKLNTKCLDNEKRCENLDKKKNTNLLLKRRNNKSENEKENFLKTEVEYYKKSPRKFKKEELLKPYVNSHKKIQNILIQTNQIDNIQSNLKALKKEKINNIIQTEEHYNLRPNRIEQGNANGIECKIVNLNLLDLPKSKNNNKLFNEYVEKSYETKNNINKTKSINSVDSKIQIKTSPVFGRTTYNFYNLKETGKINSNENLNSNSNE